MIKNLNTLDDKKDIYIENIIIGSGAGGATTAFELLKKGMFNFGGWTKCKQFRFF